MSDSTLFLPPDSKAAPDETLASAQATAADETPTINSLASAQATVADEAPTTSGPEWKVGDIIAGTYEVKGLVGRGGFGAVYRVLHRAWGVDLAVKTLLPELAGDPQARESFVRECQGWVNLGLHPHVVTCHYVRDIDDLPRIFSEYMEGGNLEQFLEGDGREASLETLLDLALQFLDGLAFAHSQGLVHRDVKPANCLLSGDGRLCITDFGIASGLLRIQELPDLQATRVLEQGVVGTPAYMPPEQWDPTLGPVGPPADLYAFGVMLFEMCCGERPFDEGGEAAAVLRARHLAADPPDPRTLRPDLPDALSRFILRCLAKKADDRYQAAAEAREELCRVYESAHATKYPRPIPQAVDLQADSLNNRAVSLMDLGRVDDALAAWDQALASDALNAPALYNRSLIRWRRGEEDDLAVLEAIEHLRRERGGSPELDRLEAGVHLDRQDLASAAETGAVDPARSDAAGSNRRTATLEIDPSQIPGRNDIHDLAWLDGPRVLFACRDALASVDVETGLTEKVCHTHPPTRLVVNPAGTYALRSEPWTLTAWDPRQKKVTETWQGRGRDEGPAIPLVAIARGAGYGAFVLGADPRTPRLWTLRTGGNFYILDDRVIDKVKSWYPDDAAWEEKVAWLRSMKRMASQHRDLPEMLRGHFGASDVPAILHYADHRVQPLESHQAEVTALCLCCDYGTGLLLSGSADGQVRMSTTARRELVRTVNTGELVRAIAAAPDDRTFVTIGDRQLVFWDMATGERKHACPTFHRDAVTSVFWGPNALLTVGRDRVLKLRDPENGRVLRTFDGLASPTCAFRQDGSQVVAPTGWGRLGVWSLDPSLFRPQATLALSRVTRVVETVERQRRCRELLEAADASLQERAWGRALEHLREARSIPGYERSSPILDRWKKLHRTCRKTALAASWRMWERPVHDGAIGALALSGDGRRAFTAGADGRLRAFSLPDGTPGTVLEGQWAEPLCLATDFTGTILVSGHADGTMRIWDIATGQVRALAADSTSQSTGAARARGGVESVRLSRDASLVLAGHSDGRMRLWEAATGRCVRTLEGRVPDEQTPVQVFWNSDTRSLVAKAAGTAEWSTLTGKPGPDIRENGGFRCGDASLDVRRVLLVSGIGDLELWDLDATTVTNVGSASDLCRSVALSADGRWAALGEAAGRQRSGGAVRIWDVANRACVRELEGRFGDVTALALAPEGDYLVFGDSGGVLRLWALDWALEAWDPSPGDPQLMRHLEDFLRGCIHWDGPEGGPLMQGGPAAWDDASFERLLFRLGTLALGGFQPRAIERRLELAGGRRRHPASSASLAAPAPPAASALPTAAAIPAAPPTASAPPTAAASPAASTPAAAPAVADLPSTHPAVAAPVLPAEAAPASSGRLVRFRGMRLARTLGAHEEPALAVACSRDGRWAASSGKEGIRLWDLRSGRAEATLGRDAQWSPALSLLFSEDGLRLYSAHQDGKARVWDLTAKTLDRTLDGGRESLNFLALSADGRKLMGGQYMDRCVVWDLESGRSTRTVQGPSGTLGGVAFSCGEGLVAAFARDLQSWPGAGNASATPLQGHTLRITSVSSTADGKLVLTSSLDHTMRLWDVEKARCLRVLHDGGMGEVAGASLCEDGRWAIAASEGRLLVWDLLAASPIHVQDAACGPLHTLAWSRGGETLVAAEGNGSVSVWTLDWERDAIASAPERPSVIAEISATPAAPRGRQAITRARERRQKDHWGPCKTLCTYRLAHVLSPHVRELAGFAITPQGDRMVTAGHDGRIVVTSLDDTRVIQVIEGPEPIFHMQLAYDGRTILTVDRSNTARVHDLANGQLLRKAALRESFNHVRFSSDLTLGVASPFSGPEWFLIDLVSGRKIRTYGSGPRHPDSLHLSEDGRRALTSDGNAWIRLWDVGTGASLQVQQDSFPSIRGLSMTPDGQAVTWSNLHNQIWHWHPSSGRLKSLRVSQEAMGWVVVVAVTRDGCFAAWGGEKSLAFVNLETMEMAGTLDMHGSGVADLQFSPDASCLVAATSEGQLRVFSLEWESGPCLPPDETRDGLLGAFVHLHTPRKVSLPQGSDAPASVVTAWLRRGGEASWDDADVEILRLRLRNAGYGETPASALQAELANWKEQTTPQDRELSEAAGAGRADEVRRLLAEGARVETRDDEGDTVLHRAVTSGSLEVVDLVLGADAPLEAENGRGLRPLHEACHRGHTEIVQRLLAKGATVKEGGTDGEGRTALHMAVEKSHVAVVKLLLARGCDLEARARDPLKQRTAAHLAAALDDPEAVRLLAGAGADILAVDKRKQTPLHIAAELGCTRVIEALAGLGADLEATDYYDCTPLHLAAEEGHVDAVEALTRVGASIESVNKKKELPVAVARRRGHEAVIRLLDEVEALKHPKKGLFSAVGSLLGFGQKRIPEGNIRGPNGQSPLHGLATQKNHARLQSLLSKGANPNLRDTGGFTPLVHAVRARDPQGVAILLEAGASLRFGYGQFQENILHVCATTGDTEVAKKLLAGGGDVNVQTTKHETPLGRAVHHHELDMVRLLLDHGADATIAEDGYGTPYERCRDSNPTNPAHVAAALEIGKLLIHRGLS